MNRLPFRVLAFARTSASVILLCLAMLAGCAGNAVQVRGVAPLNRNAEGESTPLDLRLFALRREDAFASAAFTALWTDPQRALGPDLIGAPVNVTVLPGAAVDPARLIAVPGSQATCIGVLALVRQQDDLPRTLIIPVAALPRTVVEATGYGLRAVDRR
jgi:type VI secretion system VasD/TssJ family lipoprotein